MTQKERINILNVLERLGAETICSDCMFRIECMLKERCIYDMAHDLIENDDSEHVVRCKNCKHAPREEIIDGKHYIIEPKDEDGTTDNTCPYVCMDWYYTEVPDGDSFCNKGERKECEYDD